MIDFRYHVVSLVAVFIALSIGMVIGGFALRGPVADQLNSQVKQLSADKATLRDQLVAAQAGAKQRDTFDEAVSAKLVAGTLAGHSIALVSLPDTDKDLIAATEKTLRSAGAKVASTTSLSDGWADPKDAGVDFAALASGQSIATSDATRGRVPGLVLARAVLDPGSGLLDTLSKANLTTTSSSPQAATAVVVLWSGSGPADHTASWTDLTAGVGTGASATLAVSGGPADAGKPDLLMTALRDTPDVNAKMSTVDDGGLPMGQVALAFALRDEATGTSGQFGMAQDATAVLPARR